MHERSRAADTAIIVNGGWNTVANITAMLLGVASSILMVRQLSPSDYGVLSYYIWVFSAFSILTTLAFPNALTKIRAELLGAGQIDAARHLTTWVIVGLLLVNVVGAVALALYALFWASINSLYLILIASALVPNALAAAFRSFNWSNEQYLSVALAMMSSALLQCSLVIVTYWYNWGIVGYLGAILSNSVVQSVVLLPGFVRTMRGYWKIQLKRWRDLRHRTGYLQYAWQATIVLVIQAIVWERSEIFFLDRYASTVQIGYYSLAYTTFAMVLTVGWAFINGFYPALSNDYGAGNESRIKRRIVFGIELATLVSVPVAFGGLATLGVLIPALYGVDMYGSVVVAQILYVGLVPAVVAGMFALSFSATGRITALWILGVIMAVTNIALDFLLIPAAGAVGAAVANLTTQLLFTTVMLILVVRILQVHLCWSRLLTLITGGFVTCYLLPNLVLAAGVSWLSFGFAVFVAAATYGGLAGYLGYVHGVKQTLTAWFGWVHTKFTRLTTLCRTDI